MIRAFFTSSTGMAAQQMVLDNTANNLANVNTTAFKRGQVDFQDMLYTTYQQPGAVSIQGQQLPVGLQVGNGVRVSGITRFFTPGALENTGNSLDVAIEGNGFFQISSPTGTGFLYSRDGSFRVNVNGQMVTVDGFLLQPQITIPQDALSVSVGNDGTVSVVTAGSPNTTQSIGQIQVARFTNPAGLSAYGRNLFSQTAASGTPTISNPGQNGTGLIRGGFLERSNVDVVQELVNLIQAQRAYEFNSKAIQVADEMLSSTNNLIR